VGGVVVTASHDRERSSRSLGYGVESSERFISTNPLGSGNSGERRLGGVLGPPTEGRMSLRKWGDGVGGMGEYIILVSLKVTRLAGIVYGEGGSSCSGCMVWRQYCDG